jgi:hypothetical protein
VPGDRGLAAFVAALVAGLDAGAAGQVRRLAGQREARIGLDDEEVDVRFDGLGQLRVVEAVGDGPACRGRSDRATVVEILGARLEVRDAVLTGRVDVVGTVGEVAAIFAIVEVLLAASARLPALQQLADELLTAAPVAPRPAAPHVPWHPDEISSAEVAMLAELDLLTDGPGAAPG